MDDNITNFQQTESPVPTWLVLLTAAALIAGHCKYILHHKHQPKKERPVPPVEKVEPDNKPLDLSPIKKLALPIACCTQPSLPVDEIRQQPPQRENQTQPVPSRIKPQNPHYFDSKPENAPKGTKKITSDNSMIFLNRHART